MKVFLLWWYRLVLNTFQKIFFRPIAPTEQPIPLLVWRDAHLGDGLLSLASLVRIRQNFPNATIILVSHNDGIPGIHFKDYLQDGVADEIWDRSNWTLRQLIQKIKENHIQHLIALMPYSASLKWNIVSMVLMKMAGIKRAGGWRKETTFLAKRWLSRSSFPSELNRLDRLLTDLNLAKIENLDALPIQSDPVELKHPVGEHLIFAPFTKGVANAWPDENWIRFGIEIQNKQSMPIVIVGGKGDRIKAEEWIRKWGWGRFEHVSIPALHSLVSQSKMVIGADSGVVHLANLLKKDNIVLFGNSDYRGKWAHPENPNQIILYPSKSCTKCLGKRDRPCTCMNYLSIEAVLNAMASYD
jgi:ADP-heptose:LPS heptosyltransferase